MVKTTRLIQTFTRLVKIDSPSFKEKKIATYLATELKKLNLKVQTDSVGKKIGGNTGNVIGFLLSTQLLRARPSLLFNAHMDTVGPSKNIDPQVKNEVIKSKGKTILGADDKAGIAAILEFLKILNEKKLPHGDILVVFTVAEEKGLLGSKNLKLRFKPDYGFVLDGDGQVSKVVTKTASQNSIKATFRGKAAHAGVNPEKGVNAVQGASLAISKMKLGRLDKETTANIGMIKGGRAANIVPDEAVVSGETRSFSLSKLGSQTEKMKQACFMGAKKVGAKVSVKVSRSFDTFSFSEDDKIVRIVKESLRRMRLKAKFIESFGGSDANFFNKIKVPAVNLSIGAENPHSLEERITIKELVATVKLLLNIVEVVNYGPV